MVDRVMVQHIVCFKLLRVVPKIVIHGVVSHLNGGIGDHVFQVYGVGVVRAGVNVVGVHRKLLSVTGEKNR